MRPKDVLRTTIGSVVVAILLAAAPVAPAATPSGPPALAAIERDLGAAMAHAAVLRERLAAEQVDEPPAAGRASAIAGIADGDSLSSLAALRLAARGLDRRVESLRAQLAEQPGERARIMLVMRNALGSLLWTLEDLPLATAGKAGGAAILTTLLDHLDRALADLATATAAMAALQW